MTALWQDIHYGLRMLRKSPGFTTIALVTLAIGIGANTAIFSVINAVLLKPLPYREADRLVNLYQQWKGGGETNISPKRFAYWREYNQVFEQIAATSVRQVYLTGLNGPQQIEATTVSPSFFSLLGIRPVLGRTFQPEEEKPGNHRVAVLSHAFWQEQWGADPSVIGRTMVLDGELFTVVGVLGPYLEGTQSFYLPLVVEESYAVMSIARLKKGVTLDKAHANMALVCRQLEQIDPKHNAGYTATVHRYLDDYFGEHRRTLLLLFGSAAFVLLIACSNVANLLLARTLLRCQEIGIRVALGASRGRIMRQVLTESILLSTMGGLLGLLVTYWTVRGLVGLCPFYIPRIGQTRVDLTVMAFTLGLSMVTGLLFGLVPALKTTDVHLGQVLKESQTRSSTGWSGQRLLNGLVVSQIGITMMLLIGAVLLIRTMIALYREDLGFKARNVLVMDVDLPQMKYPESNQQKAFFDQLLQNIRAIPGVRTAALATIRVNLARGGSSTLISIGSPVANREERFEVISRSIGRDFFETMGMRILRGRTFTEQDVQAEATTPYKNLIIDEAMARKYFQDRDPIGQRIYYAEKQSGTVVGVVSTLKDFTELAPTDGVLYQLVSQWYFHHMEIVIKTDGESTRLADALRAQVRALDKDQTCELSLLQSTLTHMLGPRSFSMVLLSAYAGTALLIACVGVYGLLQYSTTQQTHAIGIRMALGASDMDILKATLGQGFKLILIGVAMGMVGAFLLTRVISSLLYGVNHADPATFACVSLMLISVAFLACYIPARRAAKIDPMEALRYE